MRPSAFHAAVQQILAVDLTCPACGEVNLRGASESIRLDQTSTRAECSVCSREGPIETFQPPKEK